MESYLHDGQAGIQAFFPAPAVTYISLNSLGKYFTIIQGTHLFVAITVESIQPIPVPMPVPNFEMTLLQLRGYKIN